MICTTNNRNYESVGLPETNRFGFAEVEFGIYFFLLSVVVMLLSSMDSNLEAFSYNPTDGSFTALACQLTVFTNYLNLQFLSY